MAGLTDKQRRFVAHYLDCLNATEAARRAGYATPRQQGSENLSKPDIRAAIDAGLAAQAMPADEVLARLAAIARSDVRELMEFTEVDQLRENGTVAIPAGTFIGLRLTRSAPLHLVKSITPTKYGDKVELHDAQTALTTLAKAHGLLNGIDWSRIPQQILDALADGRLTVDDIRRLAATSAE